MELHIFPAVFYKSKEDDEYVVAFDDVEVFCTGKTIEEAFKLAKHYLEVFCKLSYRMFGKIKETPRSYLDSQKAHPKEIILLVDAKVKPQPKVEDDNEIDI